MKLCSIASGSSGNCIYVGSDQTHLMIDAGISGRTAQKVSEKMAVIGKKHQVICITHLAQIAAMADSHYVIEKTVGDMETKTNIHELSEKETIQELARILGGAVITDTVIQNAEEMRKLAKESK